MGMGMGMDMGCRIAVVAAQKASADISKLVLATDKAVKDAVNRKNFTASMARRSSIQKARETVLEHEEEAAKTRKKQKIQVQNGWMTVDSNSKQAS